MKNFFNLAFPVVMQTSLQRLIMLTNTIFAGQINDVNKLAGVGLANVFSCIALLTVIEGINGALETLVSQAYGFGQLQLCGVYFNRGRLVLTAIFIPLAIMLGYSYQILTFLGQDDLVSRYASLYILITLPALYFYCMFDLTKRFLNCMTITWVPMMAQLVATILHPFWCWLFAVKLEMNILGIGLAYTIS